MREIEGYGGVEFGPFSLHLKDGDPADLPVNSVRDVIDHWTEMVRDRPLALSGLSDMVIHGDRIDYLVEAPTIRDIQDRKIYIHVLKPRAPPKPMNFKFSFDFETPSSRRMKDGKKWWKRIVG